MVGSGKSRTALAYYYISQEGNFDTENYTPMSDPPKDLYIITTARKRDTLEWEGELSPFLMSTKREHNLYSNTVVIDSWNNIKKYADVKNAFFIFDEQRVVGSGAWVKSFIKIAKANEWILLSATPGDKWEDYIPVFIANGFYKNKTEFAREHIVWKRFSKFPQVERYLNTGRLIHEDVYSGYDVQTYKDICRNRWDIWNNRPLVNAADFCYALRKLVNTDEERQKELVKLIVAHPKSIIFYNFDYELELLKVLCYKNGIPFAEWNGHKHQEIPETNKWAYLVQYNAGAEGWNCRRRGVELYQD